MEVVLEIILGEETLQHNLGSACVEKVNIDAELVNLNNVEKQTGSFRLLNLSFFFFSLNSGGFYFVSFWFCLDYLDNYLNSLFHSGSTDIVL